MKFKLAIFLFSIAAAMSIAIAFNHRYSDPIPSATSKHSTDILVIGDSWVDGELDESIRATLARHGSTATVRIFGFPGERTGKIYAHFASLSDTATTCVILGGIDDGIGHFGAAYYAHHVQSLSILALQRGCAPRGCRASALRSSRAATFVAPFLRPRNLIYQYIFDHGDLTPVDQYREQLKSLLVGANVRFIGPRPHHWHPED